MPKFLTPLVIALGLAACGSEPADAPASAGNSDAKAVLASFLKQRGSDLDACFDGAPVMRDPGRTVAAPGTDLRPAVVNRLVVAIDSSGSMAAKAGGVTKLDAAKQAATRFLTSVPEGTEVGLVAFGHRGNNRPDGKAASCAAVETVYPLGNADAVRVGAAMQRFQPVGWTPLAAAITAAGASFTADKQPGAQVVYVVSDGLETCGGDPVAAARALNAGSVRAIVNVIGFDLAAADRAQLKAVANAGGGTFVETSASELGRMLDELRRKAGNVSAITTERLQAGSRITDNNMATGRYVTKVNMCLYRGTTNETAALSRALSDSGAKPEIREAAMVELQRRHEAYRSRGEKIFADLDAGRTGANTRIEGQVRGSEVRLEQRP